MFSGRSPVRRGGPTGSRARRITAVGSLTRRGGPAQAHERREELEDIHHRWELRGTAKSTPGRIVRIEQRCGGGIELVGGQGLRGRLGGEGTGHGIGHLGQPAVHPGGHLVDLVAAVRPRRRYGREHLRERGQIATRRGREVSAGVEGATGRCGEDRHRPSALASHRLQGVHVVGVDVRQFLTVDLHGHEPVVHHRGDRFVLEGFVRHDMAPVAGGVADRDEEGDVTAGRLGEGFLRPHPPVHGIVRVRAQVGAGRVGEFVRHDPSVSFRAVSCEITLKTVRDLPHSADKGTGFYGSMRP